MSSSTGWMPGGCLERGEG